MYFFLLLFSVLYGLIAAEIRHTAGGNDFCIAEGRPYRNGERIPREHVCHVCLCHLGKIECAWMDCPPPPEGCTEFTVPDHCNPTLYICPIPANLVGVRQKRGLRRVRRDSDMVPTEFEERIPKGDCDILGVPYKTGDLMGIATSFCLECRCGRQDMYCSPRCCFRSVGLYENTSSLEAAQRSFRIPQRHPLYHLMK